MERVRAIEVGLVLLTAAQSVLAQVETASEVGRYIITVVLVGVLAFHIARGVLVPGYALMVLNTVLMFGSFSVQYIVIAQALLWVLLALGVYLFPLPAFPKMTSTYPNVGCITDRLEDLDVRIFYPSPASSSKRIFLPYLHHGKHLAIGLSIFAKIPAFIFSHFKNAWLHAVVDVPLLPPPSKNGWPVLVFSHGLGGSLEMYAVLHEQLASQGYIVFALNHNDGSSSVNRLVDATGRVTYDYYHPLPPEAAKDWDNVEYKIRNSQLQQRVANVQSMINAVETLRADPTSVFYQKLNLDAIGLVGHSFGGATVVTAATRDTRVKAIVAMDVWMAPLDKDVVLNGPRLPVLHLISEQWVNWTTHMETLSKNVSSATHPDTQLYAIKDSRHNNFSDLGLFSPKISQLARAAGKIDVTYVLEVIADVTGAYLKPHLDNGNALSWTDLEAKYPELANMHQRTEASTDGYQTFASPKHTASV
ncbi:hypothetical protein SPRG_09675 [Saprolegnia parasitica CBS 223.65]|uniref:1-alkyl-2-acetylglycerophosphocholine esterase n=1 Tax=Saprolegnia parasitica (strain CBS 223.65) TaxID=695850 RepID=A0A067CDE6_SAPPC|nr:hypothetical protein SPRG_09675 [Saprolegnia parasitica CBS 223.65]KDO24842.1 hypothetical protein SPRG_09675 [Saprolegnia parasitica CBS 223.65]|eukprot:XP_012204489.1 hypothetical protein SPRG_09675 [Saprolegnia parasitica CBS 223.65]